MSSWEISFEAPRWIIQKDTGIGKKAICYLVGDYVSCARDARLIAAAPLMFEALDDVAEWLLGDVVEGVPLASEMLAKVNAAVLKAKGAI